MEYDYDEFRIGDRVEALVGGPYDNEAGDTGIVVAITNAGVVGVRFERYVDGNTLHGACEPGYGVWYNPFNLRLRAEEPISHQVDNVDLMALF